MYGIVGVHQRYVGWDGQGNVSPPKTIRGMRATFAQASSIAIELRRVSFTVANEHLP